VTAIKTPTTPSEFEEVLSDSTKMKDLFAKGEFGDFIKNYVGAVHAKDADLSAQIKEEAQVALAEMLQDKKAARALNLNPLEKHDGGYHPVANPNAPGAPLNGLFPTLTDYLQATWKSQQKGERISTEQAEKLDKIRAYQEKVPSEGGFLVPEEFRSELLRLSLESAIVRPRARVVPMGSATLRFPMIDSTTNVGSVFGGIQVYRTEEGAELVESQATFGAIKLEVTKQTALAIVTNELVKDWGAFGVFINEVFPQAMAWYEDLDFLNGDGSGAPLGALSPQNPALIVVPKESAQVAGTIKFENIVKMYARMLPSSLNSAVWIAGPDTFAQLATLSLSVGTGGSIAWLPDLVGKPTLTLLGRPVILSEKAGAVVGTQGDLSFVDFGMYLVGDRQQMTVDSSEHVKFTSDKTAFRVIQRNDGRPWLQSAITPQNGSATLSPFVQLATRS
jgi:HK97 family phage major capsid protein